ncbi:MAG: hypothetical protein WD037_08700 [Balneolales bacterium]
MKKYTILLTLLLFVFALAIVWLSMRVNDLEQSAGQSDEPELHVLMSQMQTHLHKLSLATEASNLRLSEFYLHELEEVMEVITASDIEYEGNPVSMLTNEMLLPAFEELDQAVDQQDWPLARQRRSAAVQSCNSCHQATGFGEIVITDGVEVNPFNQEFGM